MIGERIALLVGLFLVPAYLLWLGHRLRDRAPWARGAFWGGVVGHAIGLVITLGASMVPPVWWAGGPLWRDFAVHWSPMLVALAGAAVGAAWVHRLRA